MDENQQVQAENIEAVEDNSYDTSPVAEPTTSEPTEAVAQEQSEAVEQVEPERKPNRAERRIRELVEENRRLKEPYQFPQADASLQFPQYSEGQEVTPERLQADVVQTANAIAGLQTQSQIQQLEARMALDKDVEVLPSIYPELNEGSDTYIAALEDKIEARFKKEAFRNGTLDPSVRLADIAKEEVNFARAIANKSSADTARAVAQTADEGAVRPNGSAPTSKPFAEKSIKEMEAELGYFKY